MQNRHVFSFTEHPQYRYCQDVHSFQEARFAYYLSSQTVTCASAEQLFLRDAAQGLFHPQFNLSQSLAKLERFNPDVLIVTATHNRSARLRCLFKSIQKQQFAGKVAWVVIENGSTDQTVEQLREWSREHPWVVYLQYENPFWYAAPARNRGLAFVQLVSRYRVAEQFVWVVDSDDYLHNEFALRELYNTALRHPSVMTHGYAVCRYEDTNGNLITVNTIPRDIGLGFPAVATLKDEFEVGPQILSALIPSRYIPHFYYPDEFTMEDDTLSRRIMAWSKKRRLKINSIPFPCLIKTFHFKSMSGHNDQLGNRNIRVQLGPKLVTGVRAQAVLGLLHVRDYFTREGV